MARNRVIYQSEALYVSKNVDSAITGDHRQLTRVQSANYNFNISRQDVNQFGQLARIDALVLKSPTVGLSFNYYPTDGYNERALGFYVQTGSAAAGNFASGQMGASSGQNFFIVTTTEGIDLNFENTLSGKSVIGIGNGFLTDYSFDASVGNLPNAKISIEGLNLNSSTYAQTASLTGVQTPKVDPTLGTASTGYVQLPIPAQGTGASIPSALRPGDVVLDFGLYGTGTNLTGSAAPIANVSGTTNGMSSDGLHLQSASISLPLKRTPIERLGSRFAFARVVDFPIIATLNAKAIVNEIQARNLAYMLDDATERDITVRVKNPTNAAVDAMRFTVKGSRLTSESFSSSIGSNKTVDLTFETQIGGPNDTIHGVFLSGQGTYDTAVAGWGY